MAQQPNIELTPSDRPRPVPSPGAARRWTPSMRPGIITAPDQVPSGGAFGRPGPDTGYALRLVSEADLPERSPELEQVLAGLMAARASLAGRAPTPGDLETALVLCGFGDGLPDGLDERRHRWVEAVSHDTRMGATAVAEVDRDLLRLDAAGVRSAFKASTVFQP